MVKELLDNSKLNQKELAEKCNITESMMTQFLQGESSIKESTALKMAQALNIPSDEFLSKLKVDKASKTVAKAVSELDTQELDKIKELLDC
jgi:transcriptional regulator with XRE-family HTH domain